MAKKPETTPQMVARMARYLGCSGSHKGPNGELMPCESHEELMRISNRAEPRKKKGGGMEEPPKRRQRRGRNVRGYEPLGERGVISIETIPGGGLVSGKTVLAPYELVDLKASNYTKPELRENIKKRIMAGSRGGKPGQWSARKAQLLALEYRRAGGGYRGGKRGTQRSLDKWTREDWTTSDDKPAIREGGTTRYLPRSAWAKLTPAQRAATNRKKRRASQSGRQFVPNTERAREAGRIARGSEKSVLIGRAKPRVGDPDVFDNIDAARLRARTLGCIGVARRLTPDGTVVWTPCTNVSDYRRLTGVGEQARRDRRRGERDLIRRIAKKDADFYGADVLAPNYDIKALRGRLGGRGGGRRRLIPASFNPNADDADGDGLVQEGTTQERPASSVVKKPGSSRLESSVLSEAFNRPAPKKKKNKNKRTAEERAARRAQREVAERSVEPAEPVELSPTHPKSLVLKRRAFVQEKYGDISTREKAESALRQAFPTMSTLDIGLSDQLSRNEVSFVETALYLSSQFPETAANIDGMTIADRLNKMGALASFSQESRAKFEDNELIFTRQLHLSDKIDAIVSSSRRLSDESKRRGRSPWTPLDGLLNDNQVDNDDYGEIAAAYIFAHEFGHAWHGISTFPDELDKKMSVDDASKWMTGLDDAEFDDLTQKTREHIVAKFPNMPDDELDILVRSSQYQAIQSVADKNPSLPNTGTFTWHRDGLSSTSYGMLRDAGRRVSRYGGKSPEEAIAEMFAASEIFGIDVPSDRNPNVRTIWEFMGRKKSAEEKRMSGLKPELEILEDDSVIFRFPLCSGQFSDPEIAESMKENDDRE